MAICNKITVHVLCLVIYFTRRTICKFSIIRHYFPNIRKLKVVNFNTVELKQDKDILVYKRKVTMQE